MDDSGDFTIRGLKGIKLSQSNYIEWRDVIDDYIESQGWGSFVKKDISADATDEQRAKAAKIAVVLKTAAGSQRTYLLGLRTPKQILEKLEEVNGGSSKGTLSSLQQQFSSPDSKRKVDDVAALLSQLQAQIGGISIEDKPTELSKKDVLLRCYQDKYPTTIETLRIVASDYTFAQVVEKLRQAEFNTKEISNETALRVDDNAASNKNKGDKRKCYYCGKLGHIKPECRKKKSDDKKKSDKAPNSSSESAGIAWMANDSFDVGTKDWCVDSGATSHMTNDRSIFVEYERFDSTVGTAKANLSLRVVGRGKICCPINGQNTIFEGVLHIPELQTNLLSPGKLTSGGLSVNFGAKRVKIIREGRVVASGPKVGDTWVLRALKEELAQRAYLAKEEESLLWHRRLGHPGAEKLFLISQTVDGVPSIRKSESLDCHTCNSTKSVRHQSRQTPSNPAMKRLERVFMDTWGPYKYPSIGGSKYMLVIVDEFSRMSWVYFMAQKSDVLSVLPTWKNKVELESGEKLIKIRTDGAPELKKAVLNVGVIQEVTTADTPEQNAKAERMNRTIVTKARSMLIGPNLPKCLWAEAMATACYLRNLTPSVEKDKSPYEIWTGHRPNAKHLKVFGCIAYAHINKKNRDKLDENARKGIFVGYRQTTKQYRIFDPKNRKIIESSHVTFKENQKGGSILKDNESTDSIPDDILDQEEELDLVDLSDGGQKNSDTNLDDQSQFRTLEEENESETNNEETGLAMARPRRDRRSPIRLIDELGRESDHRRDLTNRAAMAMIAQEQTPDIIPKSYDEALKHKRWNEAIKNTLDSLAANYTWKIVDKPKSANLVSTKWIFKIKRLQNGEVDKYKARLVARGFSQREGVDYFEIFSGVVRLETLRILIAIAAVLNLEIEQMDFTSAFTQGPLEEDIYLLGINGVEVPQGKVLKLNRSLEGLKQSGRVWNRYISKSFKTFGLIAIPADSSVFVSQDKKLIVALYVDDMLIFSSDMHRIDELKNYLLKNFRVRDMGKASLILSMNICRDTKNNRISLDQEHYINNLMQKYEISDLDVKRVNTPASNHDSLLPKESKFPEAEADSNQYQKLLGELNWLVRGTRPQNNFTTNRLAQSACGPAIRHMDAAKRLLKYSCNTKSQRLTYSAEPDAKDNRPLPIGYSDADFAGHPSRRSTTGSLWMFAGSPVTWASKLQRTVSTSTTEAEFLAFLYNAKEAIWISSLLFQVGYTNKLECLKILGDNKAAIELTKNPIFHAKTKHIDVAVHYVRELVEDNRITIDYVQTKVQLADCLTKCLAKQQQQHLCELMGIEK